MVRPIVKYPEPILQRPAAPVTEFNDELRTLVDDMFESMYVAQGIGLAAPQIGVPLRVTVLDLSFQKNPEDKIVLINPEITFKQGKQYAEEGCLSLPDIHEKVSRAAVVKVRAQTLDGEWRDLRCRRAAGACFSARDRSSRRRPLYLSCQRAEARPHPAPHSQAAKDWRVVKRPRINR